MKKITYFFSFFIFILFFNLINVKSLLSEETNSKCLERLKVKNQNNVYEYFCRKKMFMVSESCANKDEKCELLKNLTDKVNKIKKNIDPFQFSHNRNPGSKICSELLWKAVNGSMFDGSEICICEAPSGDKVVCSSFL